MDFSLTEEQVMFKETARKFAETEIAPLIHQMEETKRTPRELIKKMRDLSFYGIQYSPEYGGIGSTYLEYAMVIEELSRVYCSLGGHISVNCLCAGTINDFGTEEQKKKYLPQLLQGDAVGSFAFTEPSTGSDPGAIRTTCVRDGKDWIINGEKIFITNSSLPGYIVVFCKDVEKDNKITNIIVPKDAKGYSTPKLVEKLGMNGMEVADVILEDVRVPFENTTGGEAGRGKGFTMLTTEIAIGKLGISAECLGMAQGALDEAVKYAKERVQRGKPISNFQTIQWLLGEMSADVEAARYYTYATAYWKSQKKDILFDSARTRLFVSQACHRVVSNAMQVLGAFSYSKEFNVERIFRDMKLAEIYEGVNEIQRVMAAAGILR
ncbi:MAG: Acyl-CoA dehydrogenase [Smithella sp. PtaU1.Bin162]|nr:MAG: Acyl-CoA dehydrogenase [Smithella sp. PtaU1.Bin162]